MFRIFYPRHRHHHHHGMGLGRALLMGLFFGPWFFRRMMRWGRYGGPGWGGPGPRGGWGGPGPRGGWRGDGDRGPRHGPRGPRGADYV